MHPDYARRGFVTFEWKPAARSGIFRRLARLVRMYGKLAEPPPDSPIATPRGALVAGASGLTCEPWVVETYEALRVVAEAVTGRPVVCSPFGQSAITGLLYEAGRQGGHGWHVESNSVTAILYLTDDEDGAGLEVLPPPISPEDAVAHGNVRGETVMPKAGCLVILRGHDTWHRVAAKTYTKPRLCLVFNLYHPDELDRPAALDGLYGYGS